MRPLSGKALIGGMAAFWFLLAGAGFAAADQKDARLPALFEALKAAPDSMAAMEIGAKIWTIWLEANDPAIDQMMTEAEAAMQAHKFGTALAKYDAIVKQKPEFAEGWNKRATVYYLIGNYEQSLADIDRTLELEPRHIGALSGLGLLNMKMEREEAAADAFERVLAIDPQSGSAKSNLEHVQDILKRKQI